MNKRMIVIAALAGACANSPRTHGDVSSSTDPCINLIENGGFEQGLEHWTANDGVGVDKTSDGVVRCRAGNQCAGLAGSDTSTGGVLSQSAFIPVGGTTSLSFRADRGCPDVNAGNPAEFQRARILDASGAELLEIFKGCANSADKPLVDLSRFAGHTITVEFSISTLGDPATEMEIDEVELDNHPDDGVVNACGTGSCDGNPECESCINDGECASGPDPVWTGTECACADFPTPTNCDLPFCCAPGSHWDPRSCKLGSYACDPDGFANTCGVGTCAGDAACEACLAGPACAAGVAPVWDGQACLCPIAKTPPVNCRFAYCCGPGQLWSIDQCVCRDAN